MKFIEMTGKSLSDLVRDDELHLFDLHASGVDDETIIRINEQGDIEVRRAAKWDVVGGLLGEYEERVKKKTGLDWA